MCVQCTQHSHTYTVDSHIKEHTNAHMCIKAQEKKYNNILLQIAVFSQDIYVDHFRNSKP